MSSRLIIFRVEHPNAHDVTSGDRGPEVTGRGRGPEVDLDGEPFEVGKGGA